MEGQREEEKRPRPPAAWPSGAAQSPLPARAPDLPVERGAGPSAGSRLAARGDAAWGREAYGCVRSAPSLRPETLTQGRNAHVPAGVRAGKRGSSSSPSREATLAAEDGSLCRAGHTSNCKAPSHAVKPRHLAQWERPSRPPLLQSACLRGREEVRRHTVSRHTVALRLRVAVPLGPPGGEAERHAGSYPGARHSSKASGKPSDCIRLPRLLLKDGLGAPALFHLPPRGPSRL